MVEEEKTEWITYKMDKFIPKSLKMNLANDRSFEQRKQEAHTKSATEGMIKAYNEGVSKISCSLTYLTVLGLLVRTSGTSYLGFRGVSSLILSLKIFPSIP